MDTKFDELQDIIEDRKELDELIAEMKTNLVETKLNTLGLRIGDKVTTSGHEGFLYKVYVYQNSFNKTFVIKYGCLDVKKDGMPSKRENCHFIRHSIDTLKLVQV